MVSQYVEQDVDQVPEEPQTEITDGTLVTGESVAFEDAAATTPEEAAAAELDPRIAALIEEKARQAADEAAQKTRQGYEVQQQQQQRRRQAENAQRANDALVAQQREERLAELLLVDAAKLGVLDGDLGQMKQTAHRVVSEVEPIHRNAALNEAARVVTYLAYQASGAQPDFDLSPREEQMASAFENSVSSLMRNPRLREQIVAEERKSWEMNLDEEVKKRVDAEMTKRQKAQKPLPRTDGTSPSTVDQSDAARLNRLAYGIGGPPTPEDQAWYRQRFPKRFQGR